MADGSAAPRVGERVAGRVARALCALPGGWLLRLLGEAPLAIDGRTLDPHVQFVLAAQRRRGRVGLCEPTIAAGRARYRRETMAHAGTPTPVGRVTEVTVPGATGPLAARHYAPAGAAAAGAPLLVYLHGGGFAIGDLDTHDEPCRQLCAFGASHVLSVAYRLAPEHPFPAAVEDVAVATRWAQDHAAALGADPARVGIGGDSAGGNLAAVTSTALAREGRPLAAQLLIYPATDQQAATASRERLATGFILEVRDAHAFAAAYVGGRAELAGDPRVNPARSGDLGHAPPTALVTAGFDPLRDEGAAYAEALAAAGVPVTYREFPGLVHGFLHLTPLSPGARAAMREVARLWATVVATPAAVAVDVGG